MAADRATRYQVAGADSSDLDPFEDFGGHVPKRHARVTVKYNRKALQRRLDVEKWIDDTLDRLYVGQVGPRSKSRWTLTKDSSFVLTFIVFKI